MNTLTRLFYRAWRPGLLALSLAVIAYLLYFHNLGNLVPGYDSRELRVYDGASDWHRIFDNPVNAPYKLLVWVGVLLGHQQLLLTRLVAASLAVVAALLFYVVVQRWHGFRTAFLTTIMFATSAGFLHVARLGSAQILQMGILAYVAVLLGYRRFGRGHNWLKYVVVLVLATLLYVPGFVWIELFSLLLLRSRIRLWFKHTPPLHICLSFLLFILLLIPLAYAGYRDVSVFRSLAGLPVDFSSLTQLPLHVVQTVLAVAIRSNGDPEFFVGHAPLLTIVEAVLGMLGLYYYLRLAWGKRAHFLLGGVATSLILVAFEGPVGTALLVPFLYLFIAAGVHGLIRQWLTVFPRNPLAKFFGVGLVCVMLFFSVLYQTRSYFVAWPHNLDTRREFNNRQP